jgi:hypothetical protein
MMNAVPVILWLIVLAAYVLPPMLRTCVRDLKWLVRQHPLKAAFIVLFLVVNVIYGSSKPPPPPPPPPPLEKRINIYYEDATGRLVPFEAPIREVLP